MNVSVRIDRASEEPVYEQVARQVRELVAAGALPPGTSLPSVRTLASDLGVNLNTVARAYRLLESEGFLRIRQRTGAQVVLPADAPDETATRRLREELRSVLARLRQAGTPRSHLETLVKDELTRLG